MKAGELMDAEEVYYVKEIPFEEWEIYMERMIEASKRKNKKILEKLKLLESVESDIAQVIKKSLYEELYANIISQVHNETILETVREAPDEYVVGLDGRNTPVMAYVGKKGKELKRQKEKEISRAYL